LQYATFNPKHKSDALPSDISFRLAKIEDCKAIASLLYATNSDTTLDEYIQRTQREIEKYNTSEDIYRVFVSCLNNDIIGYCRFFHSALIPKEKKIHSAPEGLYLMGIIVRDDMRGKGVADFMSRKRLDYLQNLGIHEVYSAVASQNIASHSMHMSFGFTAIKYNIQGFHSITFPCGSGTLYKKAISQYKNHGK
jgi:RimJ/RimL family protein N-acetyltransferase